MSLDTANHDILSGIVGLSLPLTQGLEVLVPTLQQFAPATAVVAGCHLFS